MHTRESAYTYIYMHVIACVHVCIHESVNIYNIHICTCIHIYNWQRRSWIRQALTNSIKKVKVTQLCLTLCDLMDYIVHGILQARILEWVAFPYSRDLPNPGIEPRSNPVLHVESLPVEPQGKAKNTGVGSLSLLRRIPPTQESNRGLPHRRQTLYRLSYQGNSRIMEWVAYPFSGGSSWPRNQTGVSCIAGRFFTTWAIREAPKQTNTLFF